MVIYTEDVIKISGAISIKATGISMRPFIVDGDTAVIVKTDEIKKYDAALFKSLDGKYVLHRVVKACGGEYVFRGDNCLAYERGIKREQIIGKVSELYRNGKKLKLSGFYAFRVKLWCCPPIRAVGMFFKLCGKRISNLFKPKK